MNTDNQLDNLVKASNRRIQEARNLIAQGQIQWKADELPVPASLSEEEKQKVRNASRAFIGISARGCLINVVQGNTERGIVHMGTIIGSEAPHVTVLPEPVAAEFYHAAAAKNN